MQVKVPFQTMMSFKQFVFLLVLSPSIVFLMSLIACQELHQVAQKLQGNTEEAAPAPVDASQQSPVAGSQTAVVKDLAGMVRPSAPFLPNFADLAEKTMPAVASIQVEQRIRLDQKRPFDQGMPSPFDFFRFFGQDIPREYENRSLGSGFLIDSSGLVLTNAHVVEKATRIEVTFAQADGSEKKLIAKVVGKAPDYDVALLKLAEPLEALTPVVLGDSDKVRIGDWVMAIGNPFGLEHSVSVGIISAKQRRDVMPSGRNGMYDFLQTDASINPGNSGGPLVALDGAVIGINSAINAQGQGIGFAIPINMVKAMLPKLKTGEKITRSWLGIMIQPLNDELAESFGLKEAKGILVANVQKNSPAAKAGLQEGDIILSFNGHPIQKPTDLQLLAGMAGAGQVAEIDFLRNAQRKTLKVTLETLPDHLTASSREIEEEEPTQEEGKSSLGMWLANITPRLKEQLDLPTDRTTGVVVTQIAPDSLAAKAGLLPQDILLEINGKDLPNIKEFHHLFKQYPTGSMLRFKLLRGPNRIFLALRKP